ncbi:hypothetical protein CNMCM8980_004280 [Aspergillus fumigatiaffinis]|uniref:Uncharacterized protein n=1 Tax=Aspergillus fumigatiaffinis TaxID=340414 RepID=A0A8H4GLI6_9EURO|nr:hypothetical protein CNMCM5878_000350 [Aspergillus fumigatiaffinis]KAF4224264.1 hypothetical protein CNMCM6457_009588 [Aspergillus fumigatiaffinis]KAF4231257.1 hypothetical protein CNMCM6805_000203 [Aspergillus fumigatiaffinis]KAF4233610.1 hypothetical protein CNMCM8980_004280 [Aspergillus fumigatiaffinis]
MAAELPFTIVILTLTGIASHNLYRTKLWQDGADNGFNSSPDEQLYAAANYRPYKVPTVWSGFITDYNLVLGVLSTFFLITKVPIHFLRLFYPPLSVIVHGGLVAVYIVSARYQAGSDMSDPAHPQPGAPWYITKKCTVAANKDNINYCRQSKALFAFTIIIIVLYFVEFVLSIHSCVLTPEERAERLEKAEEKRTWKEYEEAVLKSPAMIPMSPAYPQGMPAMTPRSLAFNRLGGDDSSDLPLREYLGGSNPRHSMQQESSAETLASGQYAQTGATTQSQPQMYFPPPPKKAAKT